MTASTQTIRARKPTSRAPYPVILVEGEEFAGKTWAALKLSASERVGQTYALDLGEGSADEYGAIPGARHLVLEHDGTWASVMAQVSAVRAEAARAKAAGEKPVVLVIDTMTDEWDGLKNWASERARARLRKKGKDVEPGAEVTISQDLWNDAGDRHRRLMTLLLRFPGIVVMTARGKEVTEVRDGKPVEGSKTWRVEGHKSLAFDASLWLRLRRDAPPIVVGARSVHHGVRPGVDDPQPIIEKPDNLLEWLVFDVLQVDPVTADVRDVHATKDDADAEPDERVGLINAIAKAAETAEISKQAVIDRWAREHKGQHISNAADLEALWLLLDTIRRGEWTP